METIKRWARNGDAVRQALEWGALVPLDTASEEWTDAFFWCAMESGLGQSGAAALPAPRQAPESGREVLVASHLAARFAGLYARRQSGEVLRVASVVGALGDRVAGWAPEQGLSRRGTLEAKVCSGAGLRQRWGQREPQVAPQAPVDCPPSEPRGSVTGRQRAARRAVKGAWERSRRRRVRSALLPQGGTGITAMWG